MTRTYAIGDIHGSLSKLEDLVSKINPSRHDNLIFLGDYIDRGEDSEGVIDFLIGLSKTSSCIFLRGNHEEMFLDFLEYGSNKMLYFSSGGLKTINSYLYPSRFGSHSQVVEALPMTHRDFYAELVWYYEDDQYIYVHAGVKPETEMRLQKRNDLLWIRDEFIFSSTGLEKKVIFGHTPFARPLVKSDKIGIDTGAVYGGFLTAIRLPEEEFIYSFK